MMHSPIIRSAGFPSEAAAAFAVVAVPVVDALGARFALFDSTYLFRLSAMTAARDFTNAEYGNRIVRIQTLLEINSNSILVHQSHGNFPREVQLRRAWRLALPSACFDSPASTEQP